MGLFGKRTKMPRYEGPLFGYRYQVTCAFLEWAVTLDTFTNKDPVVTYRWVKGDRNRYTNVVLENAIRMLCEAHGIPVTFKLTEIFDEWSGEPENEPGIEYKTSGWLLPTFEPRLPERF
jgi:hypothetical protein